MGATTSKRLSLGGSSHQTPKPAPIHKATAQSSRPARNGDQLNDQNFQYDEVCGGLQAAGKFLWVVMIDLNYAAMNAHTSIETPQSPLTVYSL